MSLTLAQIFALNPAATINDTDLFYLVQSPYTPGTDAGISGLTLKSLLGGTGTITSISAGTGITLTPNPITTTGSIALTVPVTTILGGTGLIASGTSGNVLTSNGTIWTSAPPAAAGTNVITDDTTTNATMFPTWVTASSGSLPLKVSSTKLSFNPSTAALTIAGSIIGLTGRISQPAAITNSVGENILAFGYAVSPVNYVVMSNSATGTPPTIGVNGTDSSVDLQLLTHNGNVLLKDGTNTIAASLKYYNAAGTRFTGLKVATAQATDLTLTLPAVDGVLNQPLVTSGAGVLSFGTSIGGLTGKISAPTAIASSTGANVLSFSYTPSAVNYVEIANNITGAPPAISFLGSDSFVIGVFTSKGGNFAYIDSTGVNGTLIRFYTAGNAHFTQLGAAAAQTTDLTLFLPGVDGVLNQPMVTNGGGTLSFGTALGGLTGNISAPNAIVSSTGAPILNFSYAPSAVNYFSISNSAVGGGPTLFSNGTSASIPIIIAPKNSDVGIVDITSTVAPKLKLFNAAGSFGTSLSVATAQATNLNLVLPALDGAANTSLITNGSGVLSFTGNAVLQRVSTETGAVATGTGTIPLDDTIPQITEGTEFMTRAITPKSATSILRIDVVFNCAISLAIGNGVLMALFQDSTANALAAVACANISAAAPVQLVLTHFMTSGTTSSTTFRIRAGCNVAATTTFNGVGGARVFAGVYASSITITEYAA